MSSSPPFVDPVTRELDTAEIVAEAVALGKLVGVFVAVSLVPFSVAVLAADTAMLATLFALLGQFVLAVGAGVVLVYAVARGTQLAGE